MRTKEMEKEVIDQQKEVDDEIEEKKSVGTEGRDDFFFFLHKQQKNKMNEPVRAASDQLGSSPIIPLHASINI